MVALAGGVAAAYTLANVRLSAALPGVAIATALMPPLCTVGIGLGRPLDVAGGALLLFVTDAVTIAFAAWQCPQLLAPPGKAETHINPGFALSITGAYHVRPAGLLTFMGLRFVEESAQERMIRTVVREEVAELPVGAARRSCCNSRWAGRRGCT